MSTLTLQSGGTVTYAEMPDSPRIRIGPRGMEATRRFRLPTQADWPKFCKALLGYHKIGDTSDNAAASVDYIEPAIPFPDYPNLFCAAAEVDPLQPDAPAGQADADLLKTTLQSYTNGVLVTASYEMQVHTGIYLHGDFTLNVPAGTYVWIEADFGGDIYATEPGTWVWTNETGTKLEDIPVGITVPSANFTIDWYPVINPPWSAIRKYTGRVNSGDFLGYPPGCVVYLGCQPIIEPRLYVEGPVYWRLKHRFAAQSKYLTTGVIVGWNHYYKKVKVGAEHWLEIQDADGNSAYEALPFDPLFAYATE